jgi:hypothetical protein
VVSSELCSYADRDLQASKHDYALTAALSTDCCGIIAELGNHLDFKDCIVYEHEEKRSLNFFLNSHSGGWSPSWVHSARLPLNGLLYLPRVIMMMENLVD